MAASMDGMEWKGSIYRIRQCVFELLSLEDDLIADDENSWGLFEHDLHLKNTFLYCDLSRVISNEREDRKRTLTDLANKLFYCMEQVENAAKSRSISTTHVRYNDAAIVLQEVMTAVVPPHCMKLGFLEEEDEDDE